MDQVEQMCSPAPTVLNQYFYSIRADVHNFTDAHSYDKYFYIHMYSTYIVPHDMYVCIYICTLLLLTSTRKVAMEAATA